jgi:hypothetical protein
MEIFEPSQETQAGRSYAVSWTTSISGLRGPRKGMRKR